MRPNKKFLTKPKSFWASVRSLSQKIGYSKGNTIIVPDAEQMAIAFEKLGLDRSRILAGGKPTKLASELIEYFQSRADELMNNVQHKLLNADEAKALFEDMRDQWNPSCPIPMNKQKGEKKAEAFLTAMVNMVIERHSQNYDCNYDPRELATITLNGAPLRTMSRRVDGAFPSPINPIAIWEIKEYYYTTTFGSRVADGVYETLLDGMEIEELREHEDVDVKHYLMADAHFTWWERGKSYLCRMYDMLHMGYVDEILFGREVVEELPRIVAEWVSILEARSSKTVS